MILKPITRMCDPEFAFVDSCWKCDSTICDCCGEEYALEVWADEFPSFGGWEADTCHPHLQHMFRHLLGVSEDVKIVILEICPLHQHSHDPTIVFGHDRSIESDKVKSVRDAWNAASAF